MIDQGCYQLHGHQAQWCRRVPSMFISGLALTLRSLRSVSGPLGGEFHWRHVMSNYNAFALSNYYSWEMLKIGRVLSLPHLNLSIAFLKWPSCHMWMRQVCWKTGGRTIGHNGTGIFYALNWISIAAKRRNCRHSRPTHRLKSQRLRTQTVSTSATPENRIPMLWMTDGYSSNN